MKKIISKRKLGRETSHRLALMRYNNLDKYNHRNQVTSLILHERIKTTVPKAKELRVYADHVITWGKQGIYHFLVNLGDLHAIREINKIVYDKEAAKKVFEVLAPRYKYFCRLLIFLENVQVVIQEF